MSTDESKEESPKEVAVKQEINNDLPLQTLSYTDIMSIIPETVRKRLRALKNIQLAYTSLEVQYFLDLHNIECKYHDMRIALYEKRASIVKGDYEPNEEESDWPSDDEEQSAEEKIKVKLQDKEIKGIPDFWLTIFNNVEILREMIQVHDEPILKHLVDIKLIIKKEPMGFVLEFHFAPNEYFTNAVLTKEYFMKCELEDGDPFSFEGPAIFNCKGCKISWKPEKNVTIKIVRKKQKHKTRGDVRTITKHIQNDSFFNFFSPPELPDSTSKDEDIDDDLRNSLNTDFEIGHYIKERIIPRAVLHFTGEEVDYEEDYREDDDEDDNDYDDDEDDGIREENNNNDVDEHGDCNKETL